MQRLTFRKTWYEGCLEVLLDNECVGSVTKVGAANWTARTDDCTIDNIASSTLAVNKIIQLHDAAN